ncbi:MAG: ATP synthase F1 subunit delta [Chloroflexi bacterium RBG_13_53_26]|nr:MAG: ATP synthase F1 subunit delta [Chloroflexi bacterium RBG_13_53_26]
MGRGISGRRHAQAVFRIALESDQLDRWQTDLVTMATVLQDAEIVSFLENPKVSMERKRDLLRRALGGIKPAAMNLAYLLVAKKRLRMVPSLVAEYRRLVYAHKGIVEADVVTAIPITDQEEERIGRDLAVITGKTVMLAATVDAEIMGGLVVKVGDKLMDGSVRTRLQELRRSLV